MLFSEPAFLFFFLPAVLAFYFLPWQRHRNVLLVLVSLGFYAWGEKVGISLISILLNDAAGVWVGADLPPLEGSSRTVGIRRSGWIRRGKEMAKR